MIEDGLDYDNTVNKKKIVFKGKIFQVINTYIFVIIIVALSLFLSFFICKSILTEDHKFYNDLMAVLIPLVIISTTILGCLNLLKRDQLKEIKINVNREKAKAKLIEASKNLNWTTNFVSDHYLIFITKFDWATSNQTITIVIFPNNRFYFNSVDYPNDYIKPARFMDNYKVLVDEYLKIEKQ